MAGSLQDRLKARRDAWFTGDEKVPVPGYGGELVGCYARADWAQFGPLAMSMSEGEPSKQNVEAAVKMLVSSNTGMEAHVDGKVAPIDGVKLGVSLAAFLGIEGADTDTQAVYLIFPGDVEIMEHVSALTSLQKARAEKADGAIAGN